MSRLSVSVVVLGFSLFFAGAAPTKTPGARNTITGTVGFLPDPLSGSTPQPIADVIAIAYNLDGKSPVVSNATGADGRFSLVVPESVKGFRLQVHQRQAQYWDYRPEDPIPNNDHPHDLGEIILNDKFDLSELEATGQIEAAELLRSVDDPSAALLVNRATAAFLRQYRPPKIGTCSDAPPPVAIEVAYRPPGIPKLAQLSQNVDAARPQNWRMLLHARAAVEFMRKLVLVEHTLFTKTGSYAGYDALRDSGAITISDFFPPGYCIDVITGSLDGRRFVASKGPSPSYYLLFAAPAERADGNLYLYSDPTGKVRYSRSSQGIKALEDARPISNDFPLGLNP